MFDDFKGAAKNLDIYDIPKLANRIGVSEDHLRAFLDVEARSRGFDKNGRPVLLFEPHVFYRNIHDKKVRDKAAKAGLAYKKWGEKPYPKDSYVRLKKAVQLDEDAALMACSIGLSQILVENYSSLGYKSPQEMWRKFMDDEEEHVEAMIRFILINGIVDDLRAERWDTVARIYNGPGYKKNHYAEKLAQAYAKFKRIPDVDWNPIKDPSTRTIPSSDSLRSVQKQLRNLGYPEVGAIDGKWGTRTRAAILAFRADQGLPLVADVDEDLMAALLTAPARYIDPERAKVTTRKVRKSGSRIVAAADKAEAAGVAQVGLGGIMAYATFAKNLNESISPVIESLKSASPLLLLGLGTFVIWQQWRTKKARVQDQREGKHAGRG